MHINLSRDRFGRLVRRYDGEGGGGAHAAGTTTATSTATPSTTIAGTASAAPAGTAAQTETYHATETKPFKSFASEAEYQKELDFRIQQALKTHEEKLKGKLTLEIRKQLEAEANMTAEQKYQAQLEQLEADKKALAKEKVRIKAESLFSAKGIAEADRAVMLDSIVDDDEEGSLKRAQALIDVIDKATNEKIKAEMVKAKPPATGKETGNGTESEAVKLAKELAAKRATATKTANSTLDYYRNGGNKK
jgi:hypothetical protein